MLEAVWSHTLAYKNGHAFPLIPFHSLMGETLFSLGKCSFDLSPWEAKYFSPSKSKMSSHIEPIQTKAFQILKEIL